MFSSKTVCRKVIINADDLGLSRACNQGVLEAYRAGVLSSASLMVGGDAYQDALALARQNPGLAVGLHLSFSDMTPLSPRREVPLLVDSTTGRFPPDERALRPALYSVEGRRQIRQEIAAQIRAFQETGLVCDHINTHRNIHLHPISAMLVMTEAARAGIETIRFPWDPPDKLSAVNVLRYARFNSLRLVAASHGLKSAPLSIGRQWQAAQLLAVLTNLPPGVTEIYCHPIRLPKGEAHMFGDDLAALLDEKVRSSVKKLKVRSYRSALLSGYSPIMEPVEIGE